jgi:hypothetical protein
MIVGQTLELRLPHPPAEARAVQANDGGRLCRTRFACVECHGATFCHRAGILTWQVPLYHPPGGVSTLCSAGDCSYDSLAMPEPDQALQGDFIGKEAKPCYTAARILAQKLCMFHQCSHGNTGQCTCNRVVI